MAAELAVIDKLVASFEAEPLDGFVALLRRRLSQLGVCMVDGRVVARPDAEALAAELIAVIRGRVLGALVERPGDALRVLDALCATGYTELEAERAGYEADRARRFPPPAPVTWREVAELRALAAREPALCRIGPPVSHVEFAVQLEAAGAALPGELLALYAACAHVALTCRHVAAPAGGICAGEELRVRDGRVILFDRKKRHPMMLFVEQPGVSIMQAIGTWWLVLEDEHAPATRRPLDLQGLLRFALHRLEAPTLEALVTDLAWRRFFT